MCIRDSWSAPKKSLWQVVLDAERYMKDVQHYVGEYAAKKFEINRNLLPELHRGQQRLQKEREQQEQAATASKPMHTPDMSDLKYRAYRTLLRLANSMNRCISKSQAEMSYQLLYESECFLTHQTYTVFMKYPIWAAWEERENDLPHGKGDLIRQTQEKMAQQLHKKAFDECSPEEKQELTEEATKQVSADFNTKVEEDVPLNTLITSSRAADDETPDPNEQPAPDSSDSARASSAASPAPASSSNAATQSFGTSPGNQKDDYMHRGDVQPLRHMSFYTYSRWVRRVPKQAAHEQDNRFFEFSTHYVHHINYVQELRVSPIVVQLEGLSLPTCCAKPERNAAIKLCLFKPFAPCEGISQHTDNKKKQKLCKHGRTQ